MESLIQTILAEIVDIPTAQSIVKYVPRFVAFANTLSVPGAEKRAVVLRGLHELVQALKQAEKISVELQTEMDNCIDTIVPPMIDAILDVASGRVSIPVILQQIDAPKHFNCLLGCFLRKVVKPQEVAKEAKEVAKETKEVTVDVNVIVPKLDHLSEPVEEKPTEVPAESV